MVQTSTLNKPVNTNLSFNTYLTVINELDAIQTSLSQTLKEKILTDNRINLVLLEKYQFETHSFSWFATYVEALRQMVSWAQELELNSAFGELEETVLQIAFGEYLSQIDGGIPMNQGEIARISSIAKQHTKDHNDEWNYLVSNGNTSENRERLIALIQEQQGSTCFGKSGLDEEMEQIRDQFFKFVSEKISPVAQKWHLDNSLIPMEIINELADLGVFGLTIPFNYEGSELPKIAMCVVSEELSRGYLGVGSLATRCEIASELVLAGGTEEQKTNGFP